MKLMEACVMSLSHEMQAGDISKGRRGLVTLSAFYETEHTANFGAMVKMYHQTNADR
jgi:hypothetical protein